MNTAAVTALINQLPADQLQALKLAIDARLHTMGAHPISAFKRGDLVEFDARNGRGVVRFRVERINDKSIGGQEVNAPFRKCRAHPSFCRLVGADKQLPAMNLQPKAQPAPAYRPDFGSAPGAGGW